MHEHKIDYYNNQANKIKTFFINLVDEKIQNFNEFDKNLKSNIDAYSKTVDMTNNKLTMSWQHYQKELNQLLIDLDKRKLKEDVKMPNDIWQLEELIKYSNNIKNQITELTSNLVVKKIEKINKKIENEIYHPIDKLKSKIANLNFNDINEVNLNTIFSTKIYLNIDIEIEITNAQQNEKLLKSILEVNNILIQVIQSINDKISSNYKSLMALAEKNSLIGKYEEIIFNAQDFLNRDVNEYFSKVEIYRSGVTALRQNEVLSQLKIAEEINKIQNEFDEKLKTKYQEKTKDELFRLYSDNQSKLKYKLKELYENTQTEFNNLKSEDFTLNYKIEADKLNIFNLESKYIGDTIISINREIEKSLLASKEKSIEILKDKKEALDKDISKFKKKRRNKLIIISILTFVITSILSYSYIYFNFEITSTLKNVILTGIISSLISTFVTYLFNKIKENTYKLTQKEIEKDFEEEMKLELIKIVQEEFLEKDKFSIDSERLQNEIKANLEKKIEDLKSSDMFLDFGSKYKVLSKNYETQLKLLNQYKDIFKEFHSKVISYFNSPDTNIETLSKISNEIKNEVMLPSFNLFEKFKNRVIEIKNKIEKITFL